MELLLRKKKEKKGKSLWSYPCLSSKRKGGGESSERGRGVFIHIHREEKREAKETIPQCLTNKEEKKNRQERKKKEKGGGAAHLL